MGYTEVDFIDEAADEILDRQRKRKSTETEKKKKTTRPKWKASEIEIDELEKRSCLWNVFNKEYHNRERREISYTELTELIKAR